MKLFKENSEEESNKTIENIKKSSEEIEKLQKEREFLKKESQKLVMEKNKEINVLVDNNKDLEEQLVKERLKTSTLVEYIRDINHQEALNIKSEKIVGNNKTSKTNISLKNFSDRMELYQKVLNKKLMNQKLVGQFSLKNNEVNEKQMESIRSKSIKLMNFFQSL